jgi:uncharacterized protein YdaU (DUF1376 family)
MAALPYMPLFVADYLADTQHLTPAQHGAYLLLIMNYWQRGEPLPNDDARLAKIARMSKRDWAHNREVILEFFTVQENLLVHHRIAHELSRVVDKSLKSKRAAQASVQRRFGERSAPVEPTDTEKNKVIPLAKANGGNDDPEAVFWSNARAYLRPHTKSDPGALIQKWLREHQKEMTVAAVNAAQMERAVDPVAYIQGYFRRHGQRAVANSGWDGMA